MYSWNATDGVLEVTDNTTGTTEKLAGMQVLEQLVVNSELTETDGHKKLATRSAERDDEGNILYQTATGDTTTDITQAAKDANGNALVVDVNGTGDGSNAVWIAALMNCEKDKTSPEVNDTTRVIGNGSLFSYYNTNMTTMGSAASNMNGRVEFQSAVMTQVENLRSSTSGVNWDEELSNMITFQQGYSACSRCLTTMDECLDKLINSTGTVGR